MDELRNRIIISAQPEDSFPDFKNALGSKGVSVYNLPMIAVQEATLTRTDKDVLKYISNIDWLVFTSRNGVHYFLKLYNEINDFSFKPGIVKTAVIGKKTGDELIKHNIVPDYISKSNLSEVFARELKETVIPRGSNVLLFLGDLAGMIIQNTLAGHAEVKRIDCYRTTQPDSVNEEIIRMIALNEYDLIVFTSSSGFENFIVLMKQREINLEKLRFASIGKPTTRTMHKYKMTPVFTARQSNFEGMANEIMELYNLKS